MKKLFFLIVLCCFCFSSGAQDIRITQKLAHLCAPLDKTQVPTGYLYNLAMPLVEPLAYRGDINDSNAVDINVFGMLYGNMQQSKTGTNGSTLPSYTTYIDKIRQYEHSDTVPLALLAIHYDHIKPYAVSNNLLSYSNGQYHDVPNRTESPYFSDTSFVGSVLKVEVNSLNPTLMLPTDLIFKNIGWSINNVEVDADDGLGWRGLAAGGTLSIHYAADGTKDIKLRIRKGGRWWQAHTHLNVSEPPANRFANYSNTPDESFLVTGIKPHLGGFARGKVQFFYSCGAKKLRRPLIVVEGFEFPGLPILPITYTTLFDKLNEEVWDGQTPSNLKDYLSGEGYDLIYVDLENNVDYIQRNAFMLEEVIRLVNQKKAEAGSTEPNVVLGVSLGGLIGKYALLDMETNNLSHDTRLFITYDSPLRGANIPIGIQCMVKWLSLQLGRFDGLGGSSPLGSIPALNAALGALDAPAPRQMLLQRAEIQDIVPGVTGITITNAEQVAFQAELDAMGALSIRHVALANGTNNGTPLENDFVAGGTLYTMAMVGNICFTIPKINVIMCADMSASMTIRATGNNVATEVFAGSMLVDIAGVPGESVNTSISITFTGLPLDVMPGGNSNLGIFGVIGVDAALRSSLVPFPSIAFTSSLPGMPIFHHTFIPTFSSLSAVAPSNPLAPQPCGSPNRCNATTVRSTNEITSLQEFSQAHVQLDARIGDVIREELEAPANGYPYGQLVENLTTYYNMGSPAYNRLKSINISTTNGKLSINNQGRLGYALGFEANSPLPTMNAFTFCDAVVNVQSGATLAIGGDHANKSANLFATGAEINIKSGGKLVVHNNSALVIQENATLTLEPGAIIELRDNPDAGLVENGRARIKIEKGGKIVFGGDVTIIGDGCFEFDEGHIAEFPKNFTLIGAGKPYRFIKLNRAAVLEKTGGNLTLRNGTVEVGCSARVFHKEGVSTTAGQLRFKDGDIGCVPNPALDQVGLYCENGRMVTVRDCEFRDVDHGLRTQDINFSVVVANSSFYNNYGLDLYRTRYATVTNIESLNSSFRFDDMSVGATLLNCTLINGWISDPIVLKNVKVLIAMSSTIDAGGGSYGINALQGENNINLSSGTTIQNAIIAGVGLNGGVKGFKFNTDYGLLRMDCARILDCGFACVGGEDILLDIDALNNSGGLRANEFRKGNFGIGENFFDICYIKRSVPGNVVNARGNVWNVPGGIPVPSDYFMRKALVGGACDLGLPILLNAGNPAEGYDPSCRTECTDCFTTGHSEDRNNMCMLDGVSTKSVSDLAWKLYLESWVTAATTETELNHDAAIGLFEQVADVDEAQLSSATPECQHLNLVSQVFVAPLANGARRASNSLVSEKIILYPNPSSEQFVIEGPKSSYTLLVHDSYGRVIYRNDATGTKTVDTATWPSGIYLVELQGPSGRQRAKVVVQH